MFANTMRPNLLPGLKKKEYSPASFPMKNKRYDKQSCWRFNTRKSPFVMIRGRKFTREKKLDGQIRRVGKASTNLLKGGDAHGAEAGLAGLE